MPTCEICGEEVKKVSVCRECNTNFCELCGDVIKLFCEFCQDEEDW